MKQKFIILSRKKTHLTPEVIEDDIKISCEVVENINMILAVEDYVNKYPNRTILQITLIS